MVSAVGVTAAILLLLGQGFLVTLCARLASHGRSAEGRNGEGLPWWLAAASAGLTLAAMIPLIARYATGTLGARPEAILVLGLQALAGFLLVSFLQRRHELLHGERSSGTGRAGMLLLFTSAAGTLASTAGGFGLWAHLLTAVGMGAWAWALLAVSASVRRTPAPAWASTLAMAGAQLLVAGALARVLLANAAAQDFSVFPYTRLLTAGVGALAIGLSWPALSTLAAEPAEAGDETPERQAAVIQR